MTAIKLTADPTFDAAVSIPVPGKSPVAVRFTFKHRTAEELQEFLGPHDRDDVDYVMDACEGWELTDDWNRENVAALLTNYHAAARAIATTYLTELPGTQPREIS